MNSRLKGSDAWATYLEDKQLPVLKQTLSKILNIAGSDKATVKRLAEVVLEDADLASSVLKLANSALFNPSQASISTISRAIMVIGFNSVKSMAITSLLVDRISKCKQREHLYRCLAKSLHAAVQAKYLAQDLPLSTQEEIFVVALLSNLGEAAFWASNHDLAEQLANHSEIFAANPYETQREFLGTTFKAITRTIAKNWNLGHLFEEALSTPKSTEAKIVATACNISTLFDQATQLNINVDVDKASLKMCSQFRNEPTSVVSRALRDNRKNAIKLATTLGIKHAGKFLKDKEKSVICTRNPDPSKQIEFLQKVSMMTEKQLDEKSVDVILNCLHIGVGFERVACFLTRTSKTPNNTGAGQPLMQFQLFHSVGAGKNKWFSGRIFQTCKPMPINDVIEFSPKNNSLLSEEQIFDAPFGDHCVPAMSVLIPISSGYQALIYADRCNIADITQEQVKAFELLMYTVHTRMTLNAVQHSQYRNV